MPRPLPTALRRPRVRRAALLGALCALAAGCKREAPPGAQPASSEEPVARQVGTPTLPSGLAEAPPEVPPAPSGSAAAPGEAAPWTGPYFVVTDSSAGAYAGLSFAKKGKLGYLRSGSKVPVLAGTVPGDDCTRGFYRLRDGGYVCSNAGTTNLSSPEARFSIKSADMTAVLPYTYARNAKNGTPLYRSVPTVEQMNQYEPYLVKKEDDAEKKVSAPKPASATDKPAETVLPFSKEAIEQAKKREEPKDKDAERSPSAEKSEPSAEHADAPDGGAESEKPWWQRHDADKRLHEVKLDELEADADDILAKRMVKGFYVAVDREFNWNGRLWYKTTKGLVAPADRFWVTQGSEFKGVELDGEKLTLPIAWTYGFSKSRPKYTLDAATNKLTPAGSLDYHGFVALTGKDATIAGKKYLETKDGSWVLASQLRVTEPGPPPADIGPTERWVDVNLTTQTLVAYEGTKPVFATLVSSGKHSQDKEKDHSSPTGDFRIREKHVTTTMDGDGSAAGDLPYSIEDVPYVMYFHKAYALHGAFWHSNYGVQMSHGCVNLAPLDAKWIFLFTEPHLPEGWHGVWATQSHPGSRVVIHE